MKRACACHVCAHVRVQYYGASKNMGVAAKTLGFLKIRAQGLQILAGPYFFSEIVVRGCSSRKFWSKIVE